MGTLDLLHKNKSPRIPAPAGKKKVISHFKKKQGSIQNFSSLPGLYSARGKCREKMATIIVQKIVQFLALR